MSSTKAPSQRLARRSDYVSTFVAEGLFILSYVVVFRLVADHFGPRGFGEYALTRRSLALLQPLGALGLDVAVARYVAYASDRLTAQRAYLAAALAIVLAAILLEAAVLLGFRDALSGLFFGSAAYADLVPPLAAMLGGSALSVIAYGYFRGRIWVTRANLLRVGVHAVWPLLAVLFVPGSVTTLLWVIGIGWMVISLAVLAVTRISLQALPERAGELLRYGLPRTPGDLLTLALFAAPGIVVARSSDVASAGMVAFGIAVLGMVASAVYPVSFILLPVATRQFASGRVDRLRGELKSSIQIMVVLIVAGTVVFELATTQIVLLYLGPGFVASVNPLRILILGALPWALYISLKSIIDARHRRAINARNVFVSTLVFAIISVAGLAFASPTAVVVPVFVVSLYVLGLLTLFEVWRATRSGSPAVDEAAGPEGSVGEPLV